MLNYYKDWAQILLDQPGDAPVLLLSQEGVTQDDPLSMVLCGITLVPLVEDLRDTDNDLLSSLYANDAAFDGSARRSAAKLRLLIDQGTDQGVIP